MIWMISYMVIGIFLAIAYIESQEEPQDIPILMCMAGLVMLVWPLYVFKEIFKNFFCKP